MSRARTIALWSLAVSLTISGTACFGTPEEAILQQFFRASRLNDNTSLGSFATARFEPRTHGTVAKYDVVTLSPERREPLTLSTLAEAQRMIKAEAAVVELSLADSATPIDPTKREGEMVSKEVTIVAPVRMPDGSNPERTLVITMQRAVFAGNPEIVGKWIVTGVRDATGSSQSKTS